MDRYLGRVPALRTNQMHARWRAVAIVALACLAALAVSASARAAVTIGQLPATTPAANCTTANLDYLQPSVTGGNLYNAREAGTITSWSTRSPGVGASYVLKIFRRTSDPDAFQVIARAPSHNLSAGLNTVGVNIHVESGDMIGFHESGLPSGCTFPVPGDSVLTHVGDIADGSSGTFAAVSGVRLNLLAVLVPDNGFTLGGIVHDRKRGTASITADVSNPGVVTLVGKGLKKRGGKNLAVAGPVTFQLATTGKTKRLLQRKGKAKVPVTVTFFPTGGVASAQTINLKLIKTRPPPTSAPGVPSRLGVR
jgi:hypothetical protein